MIANNLVDFAARYRFDITANSDAIYGTINDRPFTLYSGWNFTCVKTPLPWACPSPAALSAIHKEALPSEVTYPFSWEEEAKVLGPVFTLLGGEISARPSDPSAPSGESNAQKSGPHDLGEDQGFLIARSYFRVFLPPVRKLYDLVTAMDVALTNLNVRPVACLVCGQGTDQGPLVEGLAYDNLVYLHETCREHSLAGSHPRPACRLFQTLDSWEDSL